MKDAGNSPMKIAGSARTGRPSNIHSRMRRLFIPAGPSIRQMGAFVRGGDGRAAIKIGAIRDPRIRALSCRPGLFLRRNRPADRRLFAREMRARGALGCWGVEESFRRRGWLLGVGLDRGMFVTMFWVEFWGLRGGVNGVA